MKAVIRGMWTAMAVLGGVNFDILNVTLNIYVKIGGIRKNQKRVGITFYFLPLWHRMKVFTLNSKYVSMQAKLKQNGVIIVMKVTLHRSTKD